MGLIAVLVMPSIVDSLNKSKETSYKVLINNIKVAAETYYEECEYGDLSDQGKYDAYCTINNNTITTTIGTLAGTGLLKATDTEMTTGEISVLDPRNNKKINDCRIKITKNVDEKFKVTYEICDGYDDEAMEGCPTDGDFGSE